MNLVGFPLEYGTLSLKLESDIRSPHTYIRTDPEDGSQYQVIMYRCVDSEGNDYWIVTQTHAGPDYMDPPSRFSNEGTALSYMLYLATSWDHYSPAEFRRNINWKKKARGIPCLNTSPANPTKKTTTTPSDIPSTGSSEPSPPSS